jgi:hypothetical protein
LISRTPFERSRPAADATRPASFKSGFWEVPVVK